MDDVLSEINFIIIIIIHILKLQGHILRFHYTNIFTDVFTSCYLCHWPVTTREVTLQPDLTNQHLQEVNQNRLIGPMR